MKREIRLVGLSAIMSNYDDVVKCLKVNPEKGLFDIDAHFRPIPLNLSLIGIRGEKMRTFKENLDEACYEKVLEFLEQKKQVLIFVHGINETGRTLKILRNTLKARKAMHFLSDELNNEIFEGALRRVDYHLE